MDITKLKTNTTKEAEGVWVDCAEGLRLKVARTNNPTYRKYLVKNSRGLNSDALFEVTRRGISKYVLLGWQNLQEDGKDVPFSSEKAEQLFKDVPDFLDLVCSFANDPDVFKDDVLGN